LSKNAAAHIPLPAAAPADGLAQGPSPPLKPSAVKAHFAESLRRIQDYADPAVWIYRPPLAEIDAQVERALTRCRDGAPVPLLGMTVAVKDNIDVAGMPTTAGCPDFVYTPSQSATVVRKLCDAGAIVVGKTNLDQFAAGLVGTRSPYGACRNVFDGRYISGGSSSGSAVAVAAQLVDAALATDTAGSGRVPAAFNNIVGLKPTRGLLGMTGVVPACRSLDCVSILARTIDVAQQVFQAARGFDPEDPYARRAEDLPARVRHEGSGRFRFGVPAEGQLEFFGNHEVERLYRAAIERAQSLGGTRVTIDFAPFREAAGLLYEGPWLAERLAAIEGFLARRPEALLPVTRQILGAGSRYSAVDVFQGLHRLQALRRATASEFKKTDVLLLPTTGTIYTIAEVEAEPIALNRNLGYYTNFVNLLDLCVLAVPAGFQSNGLPAGVSFIAPAGADEGLAALGRRFLPQAGVP